MRRGLPDRGDVRPAGRDRGLLQGLLHRLQGLHGGLPLRRDLHQPGRPQRGEVQLLRPPARHRPGAGLRQRLPDAGDPDRGERRRRPRRPTEIVNRQPVAVRRPEKGTRPKLFYRGATAATLDPLAAAAPDGDSSPGRRSPPARTSCPAAPRTPRTPAPRRSCPTTSPTGRPWDWRVSLYTWTKSIAAGAYLVPLLLVLAGRLGWDDTFWVWTAPLVAAVVLALTAVVLVADLEHPTRFFYVLTRPQWRSWLVRGGVILGRLRRRPRPAPAGRAARLGHPAARGRRPRLRAGRSGRGVHRLPVRPGQGPRPVAEPAASAAPAGPGRPRRRRGAHCRGVAGRRGHRAAGLGAGGLGRRPPAAGGGRGERGPPDRARAVSPPTR